MKGQDGRVVRTNQLKVEQVPGLSVCHTDNMEAMSTLGVLARSVGKKRFSRGFAEKCINIGLGDMVTVLPV